MMALGSYLYRATELADARPDSDVLAIPVAAWAMGFFVLVDVIYDARGHRALYEFDTRNGSVCLAED